MTHSFTFSISFWKGSESFQHFGIQAPLAFCLAQLAPLKAELCSLSSISKDRARPIPRTHLSQDAYLVRTLLIVFVSILVPRVGRMRRFFTTTPPGDVDKRSKLGKEKSEHNRKV